MRYLYSCLILLALCATSCKKDDANKSSANNTWTFTLSDGYADKIATTFEMESIILNIQGYGQLYAVSKTRNFGDGRGEKSSITVYFKGMPLADKEYKITSLDRISTHDDEVAIGTTIGGHAYIPESGGGGVTFLSEGDGSQKLSYKFSNSKGSAEFKDVKVWMGHSTARKSAVVSAKISQ